MGVSPYFYTGMRYANPSYGEPTTNRDTDLPQYNKNWYSSSDSLWYDRWKQALDILPEYIEIITCKYIC